MAENTAFRKKIAPYAVRAGQQLGMDPAFIMAQWIYETGDGSNLGSQKYNNLAGIKSGPNAAKGIFDPADSIHAGYNTLGDFLNDYVRVMKLDYYKQVRATAKPGADPLKSLAAMNASPWSVDDYNQNGFLRYYNSATQLIGSVAANVPAPPTTEKKTAFPCLCQICPEKPCLKLKK